jgi:23S rRNA pseudouridine2605 synthase
LQVTLREGKNRQIHRMMDSVGHRVSKLTRLSFAGISIDGLPPGELRPLRKRELEQLKKNFKRASD